ncbi:hypothetical protein, partial [Burkholderia ubonensis]|uniref:hypothetical protein n=1 Tax=Burkholderia ubonensis TaxID=101571 RepID=UPI001E2F996C
NCYPVTQRYTVTTRFLKVWGIERLRSSDVNSSNNVAMTKKSFGVAACAPRPGIAAKTDATAAAASAFRNVIFICTPKYDS